MGRLGIASFAVAGLGGLAQLAFLFQGLGGLIQGVGAGAGGGAGQAVLGLLGAAGQPGAGLGQGLFGLGQLLVGQLGQAVGKAALELTQRGLGPARALAQTPDRGQGFGALGLALNERP